MNTTVDAAAEQVIDLMMRGLTLDQAISTARIKHGLTRDEIVTRLEQAEAEAAA